ncbi:MAG TPA: hypothetical protein VM889_05400 [Candidatus Thermoplasmatota archaeon]|nr:hypothetical protein [Candidatus Thermoplasmatota archaeon]
MSAFRPRFESGLLAPVLAHFAAEGYTLATEVPVNGRLADVVAARADEVVAVELKLDDWRGAFRQATAYQVGADRAFVALPLLVAAGVMHAPVFDQAGVGLLGVNHPKGDVRVLLPARRSGRHLPFMAAALRDAILAGAPPSADA